MNTKDIEICMNTVLFNGLSYDQVESLLSRHAVVKKYEQDEFVMVAHMDDTRTGIVLDGLLSLEQESLSGLRSITEHIGTYGVFAEVMNILNVEKMPVSVRALKPSRIMLFDIQKILTKPNAHKQSIEEYWRMEHKLQSNVIELLARKSKTLRNRVEVLSKRSIREKLGAYFEQLARAQMKQESLLDLPNIIKIPLSQVELSETLSVNRSALARELSRLRDEGIIDYHKKDVKVLDWRALQGEISSKSR